MTIIRSYPRLHVSLFDLAGATGRKHGGAGFAIDGLPIQIAVSVGNKLQVTVEANDGTVVQEIEAAVSRMSALAKRRLTPSIRVSGSPYRHLGLGSKTALLLGVLQAVNDSFGLRLPPAEIQILSGRGGTSGIGINSFFSGGFIIDGGHPQDGSNVFGPSSRQAGFPIPQIMFRSPIPRDWRFHLCDVSDGLRRFGADEAEFFRANTPVPSTDVLKLIAVAYHTLAPAVRDGDLLLLRAGISRVSELGFKKREIGTQSESVRTLMVALQAFPACAVGMSSMGPLVYAVAASGDTAFVEYLESMESSIQFNYLGAFPGRNSGFGVVSE
jgi:beta-ribofuranosylaminobenzene 5'-phosphate synthase